MNDKIGTIATAERIAQQVVDDLVARPRFTTTLPDEVAVGDWFRVLVIDEDEDGDQVVTLVKQDR